MQSSKHKQEVQEHTEQGQYLQEVKKYKYAAHCTYAAGAGQEAEA